MKGSVKNMDKYEFKMYTEFLEYYSQYTLRELMVLRNHLLGRWKLVTDISAQNLIRDEIKIELEAIDSTIRDLRVENIVRNMTVSVSKKG